MISVTNLKTLAGASAMEAHGQWVRDTTFKLQNELETMLLNFEGETERALVRAMTLNAFTGLVGKAVMAKIQSLA